MTLTNRLSLFFLGALALVLIGFSVTVYLLASRYLYGHAEQRLETALATLLVLAELEPEGVEWEPRPRGFAPGGDPIPWLVTDGEGRFLDGSTSPGVSPAVFSGQQTHWLVAQRRVEKTPHDRVSMPSHNSPASTKYIYPAVVIKAAVPVEATATTLRHLAIALIGTAAGIWLTAGLVGRWLCRRALWPITTMAATARTMTASDLCRRLPITSSRDEVADLGLAFNDLLARLHESFERQQRFTGDASHQLRTPLTAILGQIEVTLRRERAPDEYKRVLATVHGQADQLRQIVEALLFLARADAEARLPNLEKLDLAFWLTEHLQSWSNHERFSDIRLERTTPAPLLVEAQPPLLGQLVDNLLDNACKYSQPGTAITLRVGAEKGVVVLEVFDEGCGIGASEVPHVFEAFYRSEQARQMGQAGSGLGLAIAARAANAFRGRITVTSEPGKGSCFRLELPASASPEIG